MTDRHDLHAAAAGRERPRTPGRWHPLAAALVTIGAMTLGMQRGATAGAEGGPRPNVVLMLADDQGWNGLSVAMAPDVAGGGKDGFRTPNLERLAAAGMRFSAAYAPAPVCSPSRISLQTGMSPARLHWTKAAPREAGRRLLEPQNIRDIPESLTTIAELLREAGYATAHYGKWHIGGGGPGAHGYDEHDGDTGNEHAFRFTDPNPVDIFGMADRAAAFMERSRDAGKPFFIQLSWNALHAPENARRATLESYGASGDDVDKRTATLAITADLDEGVGRVLEAIERLDLGRKTFVLYLSDNGSGGGGRNATLSGGKGTLWEGGIRVPLIVRGPGVAPGSWCHVPVIGYDLLPTLCDWADVAPAKRAVTLDGGSIAPLLAHDGHGVVRRPREELVFHFPHYQGGEGPHSAIRLGDMKLIHFHETDTSRLFDLSRDRGERVDLAERDPDAARRLRTLLDEHLVASNAQMPARNPDFDPTAPAVERRRGGKRGGPRRPDARPDGEARP